MIFPKNYLNAVDQVYAEQTGIIYPVSAAVGGSPNPAEPELSVENVVFHYDVEEDYKTNWTLTADIQVNNIPAGWYGAFCYFDGHSIYQGNVFTAADLVNGTLTFTEIGPDYEPVSPVYFAILSDWTDARNYYYDPLDPENPFVPAEGEIYAEVAAPSENIQNGEQL